MFRTSILEGGASNSFEKKKKDRRDKPAVNKGASNSEPGTFV
jgi:hypothetical protein